jgi:hypothetical protein
LLLFFFVRPRISPCFGGDGGDSKGNLVGASRPLLKSIELAT